MLATETKRILLADPRSEYLSHKTEIDAAIAHVLESGRYILGGEVSAFEAEWAAYVGTAHAIGVGNGTDALELALRALNVGAGDVVITTSNTAVATVAAIELAGASALLVDVDEQTLTLSPERLQEALAQNARVRAVIPVHLYGWPAAMRAISAVAAKHRVNVIEDCAQAHGARLDGRAVGTWGEVAAFSFYPTKNLGALGDGGAVVTNDSALAQRLRELRLYGWKERYISDSVGMNSRLDEVQAAILRVKLRHLNAMNARRQQVAEQYHNSLGDLPIVLPPRSAEVQHVYHQFVIRLAERDALRAHLEANDIDSAVLYPMPIHQQPAYRDRVGIAGDLAATARAARELLCLPIHPTLEPGDAGRVATAIRDFFHG